MDNRKAEVRIMPLYLNGVRWKYVPVDLARLTEHPYVVVLPTSVSPRCRQIEKAKQSISAFKKKIMFKRIDIPLRPGLVETGFYGVDHNLRVTPSGTIKYDVPDDPEVKYGPMGTS